MKLRATAAGWGRSLPSGLILPRRDRHSSRVRDWPFVPALSYVFELDVPVNLTHLAGIIPPTFDYFHEQPKIDLGVENSFEFLACLGADLLQHLALAADQYFLLRIPLDVECHFDPQNLGRFLKLVDEDRQRVRHFMIGQTGWLSRARFPRPGNAPAGP